MKPVGHCDLYIHWTIKQLFEVVIESWNIPMELSLISTEENLTKRTVNIVLSKRIHPPPKRNAHMSIEHSANFKSQPHILSFPHSPSLPDRIPSTYKQCVLPPSLSLSHSSPFPRLHSPPSQPVSFPSEPHLFFSPHPFT